MAAEILAVGTGALNSADVVVASGAQLTVALKGHTPVSVGQIQYAVVDILLKDNAGAYWKVDGLSSQRPARVITAAGTYRFSRPLSSGACGVYSA